MRILARHPLRRVLGAFRARSVAAQTRLTVHSRGVRASLAQGYACGRLGPLHALVARADEQTRAELIARARFAFVRCGNARAAGRTAVTRQRGALRRKLAGLAERHRPRRHTRGQDAELELVTLQVLIRFSASLHIRDRTCRPWRERYIGAQQGAAQAAIDLPTCALGLAGTHRERVRDAGLGLAVAQDEASGACIGASQVRACGTAHACGTSRAARRSSARAFARAADATARRPGGAARRWRTLHAVASTAKQQEPRGPRRSPKDPYPKCAHLTHD